MSSRFKWRVIGLLPLLVAGAALSAPGDLDPAFGVAGRVFIDVPDLYEGATAIAQQTDGKLLIGRWVFNFPSADDFSVMRLLPDGTLDSSFDGDGRTFVTLPGDLRGVTRAVRQLANGKIVVVGQVTDENGLGSIYGLVRYTADGAPDASFGTGGVVTGNFGATEAALDAVVEQPDGRLVVAGSVNATASPRDSVLARFNVDGSLDPTFGAGGILKIDLAGVNQDDMLQALVLQGDGKLVGAGYVVHAAGSAELALLRAMPDGSLDPAFGSGGEVASDLGGSSRQSNLGFQLQDDGRFVIGARSWNPASGACSAFVGRYRTDGNPDPTFNGSGATRWELGSCYTAGGSSIVLEPGGAIVYGSVGYQPADVRVTRLTAAGELDAAFGVNGTTIVELGTGSASSHADPDIGVNLVRQADGRIVVTASDQFDWEEGGSFFMVARLLASGSSAGLIGFASNWSQAPEGSSVDLVVRRTGGTAGAVSVDYATQNYDADESDYTPASGTLTWADGDSSTRTIRIAVTDDSLAEDPDEFVVQLTNPTGGAHFAASEEFVGIMDNDTPPPPPPPPPPPGNPSSGGGGALDWTLLLMLLTALGSRVPVEKRMSIGA